MVNGKTSVHAVQIRTLHKYGTYCCQGEKTLIFDFVQMKYL